MKKSKALLIVMSILLLGSLLLTCKKQDNEPAATDNEVAFSIDVISLKSDNGTKGAAAYNLADADKIILTIQNIDGSDTKYTSSAVKILQMNGSYYTQKLVLKTGTYKLTEFVLIDASGNTIYAAPLAGSQEAQNITNPLPITFTVAKNAATPVNVQVLSTAAHTPEDFGLSHFPVTEIKTLSFMIGVLDNSSDKILPATLTVSNGTYTYVQNLDSVLNNVVTVIDGFPDYTLTLEYTGFVTYTHTYTIDSLKIFEDAPGNLPLLVELEKAIDQYTLSVGKAGTGTGLVTSSPAGINCGVDCSEPYNFGSVVTLTATPDAGSTFTGWSGGGCSGTGTCQVTMNSVVSVTATFTIDQYTLSVGKAGTGTGLVTSSPAGINCGVDCSEPYNFGNVVTLTATPDAGSTFTGWSGGGCSGTGTCQVTMNNAVSVTATFTINQYTLSVGKAGTGTGLVTSTPVGINCGVDCSEPYNFGNVVTLTATPDAGSTFTGWSGGGCSGTGTCQVTMNSAVSTTATFTAAPIVPQVTNPTTGRIWMDRNLGASQVATSSTDAAAYGDLYQWGRGTDGHQISTSGTTSTLSGTDAPGNATFILAPASPTDWRSPQNGNLWQGVNGVNNPCPTGFRIPTEAELDAEMASWSSPNTAGAYASTLKLSLAGYRSNSNGSLINAGYVAGYWSSTVDGTTSRVLTIQSSAAVISSYQRARGFSVRCVKD
ncbi:MAG TPA: FISUMP domain-containing protein [Bacteroidales bacterium]|nr:FISUMP domain-containing protein [Bacteroidales bacterium]